MQKVMREKGAVNAVISVLSMALFLIVIVSIHYRMLTDNSELASEELHNGTQIALSDAIFANQIEKTELGSTLILESYDNGGREMAIQSAKDKIARRFNHALAQNFDLGTDLRPRSGALHNMAGDKKVQVLEFFVIECVGDPDVHGNYTLNNFRVYPYTCDNGIVKETNGCTVKDDELSTITGNKALPYIKKITRSDSVYPSGSTIYARVAFANRTDAAMKAVLLNNGSIPDTENGRGLLVRFDDKTMEKANATNVKDPDSYYVRYNAKGNLPGVAVTEIMDITTAENDGRE
jgi:hypothetical protein